MTVAIGSSCPKVSVVIPTRNRPRLLARAVASVMAQTMKDLEIIVVIDGPDRSTEMALDELNEGCVRVIQSPRQAGPSNARNVGSDAAGGEWVAFLDDDEWCPEKLARQLEMAATAGVPMPVIATRAEVRTSLATYHWPNRVPGPGEAFCDYLFARSSWFIGEGYIATSSLLVPKALMRRVRFDESMQTGEDSDWLIRALEQPGAGFYVVFEPLCMY